MCGGACNWQGRATMVATFYPMLPSRRYTVGLGGIPPVINTVCENALITAFARQLPQVNTGIVQEVAKDFCLGVTSSPQIQASTGNDELLQAMRTLLELHDRLRSTREVHRPSLVPELDQAASQVSR